MFSITLSATTCRCWIITLSSTCCYSISTFFIAWTKRSPFTPSTINCSKKKHTTLFKRSSDVQMRYYFDVKSMSRKGNIQRCFDVHLTSIALKKTLNRCQSNTCFVDSCHCLVFYYDLNQVK